MLAGLHERAAHLRAPCVGEPLAGDGVVELDLPFERRARGLDVAVLGEPDDRVDGEQLVGGVRLVGVQRRVLLARPLEHRVVERTVHHVGVVLGDDDLRHMAGRVRAHLDIQVGDALDEGDRAERGVGQKRAGALDIRFGHGLQDLERASGVAPHRPQGRRGLDAVHAPRVGDGHALHVLDDVARAAHLERLRLRTEGGAGERRGVRDGDGLRASERADELLVQHLAEGPVADIGAERRGVRS